MWQKSKNLQADQKMQTKITTKRKTVYGSFESKTNSQFSFHKHIRITDLFNIMPSFYASKNGILFQMRYTSFFIFLAQIIGTHFNRLLEMVLTIHIISVLNTNKKTTVYPWKPHFLQYEMDYVVANRNQHNPFHIAKWTNGLVSIMSLWQHYSFVCVCALVLPLPVSVFIPRKET